METIGSAANRFRCHSLHIERDPAFVALPISGKKGTPGGGLDLDNPDYGNITIPR